ncbi:unnamed protein product [Sphenostylis stenocarpa]|uniref:Uncharacterized protein n=1 Tax=Sphenostylis stenocarpa TaxID=92480 RepID=A0AA86TAS5_9FABA|nr:unnamed protein product [Sphenostylis stenocarpa]
MKVVVVVPLTILAVVVGQQSPHFRTGSSLAVERVTGCILEEFIESRLCYGSCKEASMKMVGFSSISKECVDHAMPNFKFCEGYGLWHDNLLFDELLCLMSLFDL